MPTRYTGGITTVTSTDLLGQFGMPDPTQWHVYFNDFDDMSDFNADATDSSSWDVHLAEAGAGEAAIALVDGDGGWIRLTNDAADDDVIFLQKKGESFKFESGKKLFFKARFKVSDATQADVLMGLAITDTTPLDVTDGVFFQKDDGDALLDFNVEKNNSATATAGVATLADDTFITVGYYYNGKSAIEYYINGVKKGTVATTNMVDDEELAVTFGIQNGEAVAKTMTVDYIFVAKER